MFDDGYTMPAWLNDATPHVPKPPHPFAGCMISLLIQCTGPFIFYIGWKKKLK